MNSTITGNLASTNGGGGICENEGIDIFVINSIIVNNYEGTAGTYTRNDIGGAKAGFTTNVYLYNSAYGVLLAGNAYEKVDCIEISKTTTPNAFAFYTNDPVKRPQLVEQSNGTWAATMEYNLMGGCDVYFDYTADGVVTVLGYGNDESINYLISESGGSGGTKVTTYQDGSERKTGVIGALGTDNITPEYRVVELDDSWTINGNTAATWTIADDGKSVTLTNNSLTSFFLSPENYINKEIIGTMKVETTNDDDIIGFVLGYQNITDENSDGNFYYDFILFDWKQIAQTDTKAEWGSVPKTSEEGYTLSRMTAELTDVYYSGGLGNYSRYLWFHEPEEGKYEILGTKYGSDNGWQDNTEHNFKIHYTQNKIIIWIDGMEIFNVEGDFKTGKFGFYNSSQENTVFTNLHSVDIEP